MGKRKRTEAAKQYDRRPDVVAKRRKATDVWIERNREAYLAQKRAKYREKAGPKKPPLGQRERSRRWYAKNAERSKAKSTAYAKKNAARIQAARRARYAADPSYRFRVTAYNAGRQRFGRGGSLTATEWKEIWDSYHGLCVYCSELATSMDHITARVSGGRHEAANVVPACKRCNSSKRTRPLLRFLLKRGILAAWPSSELGASRSSSASRRAGSCSAR